jgi:hypothetical protein
MKTKPTTTKTTSYRSWTTPLFLLERRIQVHHVQRTQHDPPMLSTNIRHKHSRTHLDRRSGLVRESQVKTSSKQKSCPRCGSSSRKLKSGCSSARLSMRSSSAEILMYESVENFAVVGSGFAVCITDFDIDRNASQWQRQPPLLTALVVTAHLYMRHLDCVPTRSLAGLEIHEADAGSSDSTSF